MLRLALLLLVLCALPLPAAAVEADRSHAVIIMYQRVGDDSAPGSLSTEQFAEHVAELRRGGYSVLPLGRVVEALQSGAPLPPKTVALTFDGAWRSTRENALPLLDKASLPYTLFFASDYADRKDPSHLTWKEIKTLGRKKHVTLGLLPSIYADLTDLEEAAAAATINTAIGRAKEELGGVPAFFAWPYGLYTADLKQRISTYKFKAVFGQQSGVAYEKSDMLALPRFSMTETYGDAERFRTASTALPLPVSGVLPEASVNEQNPPPVGFTIDKSIRNTDRLSCFVSDVGRIPLEKIGNRIEIRLRGPVLDRTRINCTLPDAAEIPGEPVQWRWFGMLLSPSGTAGDTDDRIDATPAPE